MSAKLDRSQDIKFYFGNAARDLSDLIPAWDEESFIASMQPSLRPEAFVSPAVIEHIHASVDFGSEVQALDAAPSLQSADLSEVAQSLERCQELGEQIEQKQRLLGFLIKDLKRMIA